MTQNQHWPWLTNFFFPKTWLACHRNYFPTWVDRGQQFRNKTGCFSSNCCEPFGAVMVHTCSHLLCELKLFDQLEKNNFNTIFGILAWLLFENRMYGTVVRLRWPSSEPAPDLSCNQRWKDSRWITTCTSRVVLKLGIHCWGSPCKDVFFEFPCLDRS